MAEPLSAATFIAALKNEGVNVEEVGSWRTYNRNHKGPWGPVNGVMVHHTAGTNSLRLCIEGQGVDVPGPLCIGLINKAGRVQLIGYGRTNHAGKGSAAVFEAVKAEATPPSRPGPDEIDGNIHFYGFEVENLGDGKDPYPAAQLDAVERVCAAICRAHGWTANSVIGHGEWTRRKIDPSFPMADMRNRIAARLKGTPKPSPEEEADVATTEEIWSYKLDIPDGRKVSVKDVLAWSDARHNALYAELGNVKTQIAGLAATVQTLAGLLGQHDDVDTEAVVAAVRAAIAEAVIDVDVTVGTPAD